MYSLLSLSRKSTKSRLHSHGTVDSRNLQSYSRDILTLTLFHKTVQRGLDTLQSIPFINDEHGRYHYISDIVLVKLDEQEVIRMLKALTGPLSSRVWDRKLAKIQRSSTSLNFEFCGLKQARIDILHKGSSHPK